MKKILFSFVAVMAALSSCSKINTEVAENKVYDITFNVADPAGDTKAIKTAWEEGDEIMIFFREKVENGQQAKLKFTSGAWTVVQKPSDLGLSAGETIQYYAIHFPGTISYDKSLAYSPLQLGYYGGNVRMASDVLSGAVTSDGVLPLGTVNLTDRLNSSEYQVVIPGISTSTPYTLSVTCNGHLDPRSGCENSPYSYGCSYASQYYPCFNSSGSGLSYSEGNKPAKGVANADGLSFTFYYNNPEVFYNNEVKSTDPYKYVFSLYDGGNYYYYTIPKASVKTIAAGMAIKLPAFDGNGSQTYWKTSL